MGRSWVLKRAPDYIIYLNNESDIARVVLSDQSNCKGMKGERFEGERKGEGGGWVTWFSRGTEEGNGGWATGNGE